MTKAREPAHTVAFVDDYCAHYRSVFANVRHFEQFTRLELGLLAETKRKSLPRLAKTAKADPQALHHFLAKAEWSVEDAAGASPATLTPPGAARAPVLLCIDETGDRKKGKTTDYAAHQYIGNMHGLANGVVSVNAYGVLDTVTFPLAFRLFKPRPPQAGRRLQEQAAAGHRADPGTHGAGLPLQCGARRQYVWRELASSPPPCTGLGCATSSRSAPTTASGRFPGERVRQTRWRPFDRVFTDGTQRAALHPRDRLRPAPHRRATSRSPPTRHAAPRDDLGPHDQPAGQDRAHASATPSGCAPGSSTASSRPKTNSAGPTTA